MLVINEKEAAYTKITKGLHYLSDSEVLALVIAKGETLKAANDALEVSNSILMESKGLHSLSMLSVADLARIGVKNSDAKRIAGIFELSRRRMLSQINDREKISNSRDLYNIMAPRIAHLPHEEFWVMGLDVSLRTKGIAQISSGNANSTVVCNKMIFQKLLEMGATAFSVFHNHPSGNLNPSANDTAHTNNLKKCGDIMGINLLDHIIVSHTGYYSFADEGII